MTNLLETTFTFRNMDSTDALREHVLDKLTKLDKYLFKPGTAHVIFNMDGPSHVAEITVHIKGKSIIGVGTSSDMYTSVDEAVDRLKKQMSREKERVKGHKGE
ncbi:MAG TPA: ribosome-associated translation inhibitor RaiA [bacterium]|nr:ribosome-associated translation inhibitor RaiA [bacterium]